MSCWYLLRRHCRKPEVTFTDCNTVELNAYAVDASGNTADLPPHTFIWHYLESGIYNNPVLIQNQVLLANQPRVTLTTLPDCPVFYLRCFVLFANGVVISKVIRVEIPPGCLCVRNSDHTNLINSAPQNIFTIFPNPVGSESSALWVHTTASVPNYAYTITDISGRHIRTTNGVIDQSHRILIDELPSGSYFLQLFDQHQMVSETKHFIITK
jgi:Secretion system C-terminal sorting domain